ncbi:MAG: hypothetical protein ACRBHB_01900 [Arenicella sp.]
MNQNMNETGKNTIVRILGFGMIGIGLFICFYLARELLSTYNDFGSSRFVMDVTEWLNGQTFLVVDELHSVSIGEGGAGVFAILCLFLLAWTGASVAYALIKNGAQLLSPAFKSDVESIKTRLNKIILSMKGQ